MAQKAADDTDGRDAPGTGTDPAARELAPGFESILPDYPVRLSNFEGPLDLLIHLIKQNEVDVYDIPIVRITEQYLEYLELMREINLDVAGEFLVMATTLIQIKSRMLVPRLDAGLDEEAPEEDPRDALVRRLIEHQRFKAAAEMLHERQIIRDAQWKRPDGRLEGIAGAPFEPELEVDLFSLLQAFQAVLVRASERPSVPLPAEVVPIETRMRQMLARLAKVEECGFEELFGGVASRPELITTFLAALEMIRLKLIRVVQAGVCGPIRVYLSEPPRNAPARGTPTDESSARKSVGTAASGETPDAPDADRKTSAGSSDERGSRAVPGADDEGAGGV